MVYTSSAAVNDTFLPGAAVWASAFTLKHGKDGAMYYTAPVRGELCCDCRESSDRAAREAGDRTVRYFVPYKKNGGLAWSRAVSVDARMYADTEQEAAALFNAQVDRSVDWFERRVKEIRAYRLPDAGLPPMPPMAYSTDGVGTYPADNYLIFSAYVMPFLKYRPVENGDYRTGCVSYDYGTERRIVTNVRLERTKSDDGTVTGNCVFGVYDGRTNRNFIVPYRALRRPFD